MASSESAVQSQRPKEHHTDAPSIRLANIVDERAQKKEIKSGPGKKKGPAGGYDSMAIPKSPPGYTLRITFHKATNLPFADLTTLSSDPYVLAQMNTSLPQRHKQDPRLRFRTPTIRRNVNPEWNSDWILANVPSSGFELKARIYDEDPADHDDRLGNVNINVDHISDDWDGIHEQSFSIKKRMGSKRAYLFRGCAALVNRDVRMSGNLFVSVKIIGKTEGESGGRMFTIGPCNWSKHYSPMIGRLAGTKDPEKTQEGQRQTESYNFQANQIQLQGPVPEQLYHRYVEFKPFVAGMFTSKSLRGRILNRALHHQHSRVYNYDSTTVYGSFPSPAKDMSLQFLDLVHYDKGGRIYTYVLTLDGLWRFTETGKQFSIDLLSKHTMHSDVSIYIAFSGEFFIRRMKTPWKDPLEQETHLTAEIEGGPPSDKPPKDPAYYNLVIDNDSGTYRPKKELLPQLKEFMERNFPGLKVTTLDCVGDEAKMSKLKDEQRARRKAEGEDRTYAQADDSSISSSDEEELDALSGSAKHRGKLATIAHELSDPKDMILHWAQSDGKEEGKGKDGAIATASSSASRPLPGQNMVQEDGEHYAEGENTGA